MAGKSETGKPGSAASKLIAELTSRNDPVQAAHLMRFFKTGPGQYGEGDRFLGIKVPVTRGIIRDYRNTLKAKDYAALFASEWHEVRLAGFLLLGDDAARLGRCRDAGGLENVVRLYDKHLDRANNWDLVDLSVYEIMGPYWDVLEPPPDAVRNHLRRWAESGRLWRERAAMVSTMARIRRGHLDEVFWLAEYFMTHPHDLMHKASGWLLREAGKKDIEALRRFLKKYHTALPRTALRYAIEKMDKDERKRWMAK